MNCKIINITKCIIFASVLLTTYSCNNGNNKNSLTNISVVEEDDHKSPVNAIEQALPEIMIIPSDQLLKRNKALIVENNDGQICYKRNFEKYFATNEDNKSILSIIQKKFIEYSFPLTDLEQSLKDLNDNIIIDDVDDVEKDAKTLLLTKVSPDIILELDYNYALDVNSRDLNKKLSYTLNAIDSYTNKVFATISLNNLSGTDISSIMSASKNNFNGFSAEIKKYFSQTIQKGREITVRINVAKNSKIDLSTSNEEGDTYADWIIDYMKAYTKKGTYKLQRNTNKELYFTNVRISTLNSDGTQFNAYDWGRNMCKALRKQCYVKAVNKSQGLGEVVITISNR